jgi:uncharacterized membrane protein YvlD (DUF360 family)
MPSSNGRQCNQPHHERLHDVVGYIVNHYCLAFVREVVHDVVGYIVDHYCLAFVREVVYDVVGYIVNHYCLQCNQSLL